MSNRLTWEYLAETSTRSYASWSAVQVAQFNYFNPNGAMAEWRKMCDTITTFVDAGAVPSGYHLGYGSLSDYSAQQVIGIATGRITGKDANQTSVQVAVKMLREATERGYTKLGEALLQE